MVHLMKDLLILCPGRGTGARFALVVVYCTIMTMTGGAGEELMSTKNYHFVCFYFLDVP